MGVYLSQFWKLEVKEQTARKFSVWCGPAARSAGRCLLALSEGSSPLFLFIEAHESRVWVPTPMGSSKPNYPPKGPRPDTTTLEVSAST